MIMSVKYKGENLRDAEHLSPYPVSRLVPAIELVELAREVSEADDTLLFSLIEPNEWGAQPPYEFIGTYRLEPDKTW